MVKNLLSIIIVLMIIVGGCIYESNFVMRQFDEFSAVVDVLYDKIEDETAKEEDVLSVQKNWLDKKSYLHIFISHNEIKEMELWLSEAVTLVRNEKWEDALSKIEVLKELVEQTPKSFETTLQNIL